jgi:hypothetical protein
MALRVAERERAQGCFFRAIKLSFVSSIRRPSSPAC